MLLHSSSSLSNLDSSSLKSHRASSWLPWRGKSTSGDGCRPVGRCPSERRGGEQGPGSGDQATTTYPRGAAAPGNGERRPPPRGRRSCAYTWPLGQQKNLTTKFFYFFFLVIFKYTFLATFPQNFIPKSFLKTFPLSFLIFYVN
jgi:hypothetical protein